MDLRTTATAICLLFTAVDCAWDAAPDSDFITRGAGNSVANMQVQQAREMWPPLSLDNDIMFEADRFLQNGGSAASTTVNQGKGGSAATDGQQ